MGNYKKFTDFLAGFSVFAAIIYLFSQYMSYTNNEVTSTLEKLKIFFDKNSRMDYREYLFLIAIIVVSLAAGRIFAKIPVVSFVFSLMPIIQVLRMFDAGGLYKRPMLYIVISLLFISGNVVEAVTRDREDGGRRHRVFIQANLCGVILAAASFFLYFRTCKIAALGDDAAEGLKKYDIEILRHIDDVNLKIYLTVGIMAVLTVIISLILRGAYFIDLPLCSVPFVYVIYLWNKGSIVVHPMLILVPAAVYFAMRVVTVTSEVPMGEDVRFLSRNERKRQIVCD